MDVTYVDLNLTPHLKELAKELGIVDGLPFSINSDFQYESDINRFFRYLTVAETPSPNTWRTYAEQLSIYFRFLEANSKDWKDVSQEDLRDFYVARRISPDTPVSIETWNVSVSALVKFYEWAFDHSLIDQVPFTRKAAKSYSYGLKRSAGKPSLKESSDRRLIKSIRLKEYKDKFIPALRLKRNAQRDVSLSNFLITTGCRLSEALSLEAHTLADPDSENYTGLLSVPMKIYGKGRKWRQIKVPKHVLRELHIYFREDRADVIDRWKENNPNIKANSKKHPNKVWLTEKGTPLSKNSVEKSFITASEVCGHKVHPHMLRHTFAIYQLSALVKQAVVDIHESRKEKPNRFKALLRDPVRILQKLLGHARIDTTYIYLDYLEEEEAYIDSALDMWSSDIYE